MATAEQVAAAAPMGYYGYVDPSAYAASMAPPLPAAPYSGGAYADPSAPYAPPGSAPLPPAPLPPAPPPPAPYADPSGGYGYFIMAPPPPLAPPLAPGLQPGYAAVGMMGPPPGYVPDAARPYEGMAAYAPVPLPPLPAGHAAPAAAAPSGHTAGWAPPH